MELEKQKQEWDKTHQPYELKYHQMTGIDWCKNDEQFEGFWSEIRRFIKAKGNILDIGCGPRPPFKGTIIEPLAKKYMEFAPAIWWDGITPYAQPAEEFAPELEGKFDTVICWNCIDHTFNYKSILDNVVRYMKDDAIFALATDLKAPNIHVGHPSFPKEEFFAEVEKRFEIIERKDNFQEREVCFILKKKK